MRILRLCFTLASFTSPSPPCCRLTCFTHCFGNLLLALKVFSVVLCGGFRRAGDFHTAISISTYLKGKACACCRSSCWLPVFFLAASSVCSTLSWNKRYKSAVRAERDSQPFPKTLGCFGADSDRWGSSFLWALWGGGFWNLTGSCPGFCPINVLISVLLSLCCRWSWLRDPSQNTAINAAVAL